MANENNHAHIHSNELKEEKTIKVFRFELKKEGDTLEQIGKKSERKTIRN